MRGGVERRLVRRRPLAEPALGRATSGARQRVRARRNGPPADARSGERGGSTRVPCRPRASAARRRIAPAATRRSAPRWRRSAAALSSAVDRRERMRDAGLENRRRRRRCASRRSRRRGPVGACAGGGRRDDGRCVESVVRASRCTRLCTTSRATRSALTAIRRGPPVGQAREVDAEQPSRPAAAPRRAARRSPRASPAP